MHQYLKKPIRNVSAEWQLSIYSIYWWYFYLSRVLIRDFYFSILTLLYQCIYSTSVKDLIIFHQWEERMICCFLICMVTYADLCRINCFVDFISLISMTADQTRAGNCDTREKVLNFSIICTCHMSLFRGHTLLSHCWTMTLQLWFKTLHRR